MVVWMSRCCTTFAFAFFSIIINYWAVLLVATKSHIWIRNPATLLFHISKNLSIRPNRCMHKTEENRKKKVLTKLCAASHQAGNINQKAPPRFNSIIIIIIDTIIFHLRAFCTLATVTTMDGTDEHSIWRVSVTASNAKCSKSWAAAGASNKKNIRTHIVTAALGCGTDGLEMCELCSI